jgi:hypothetical protein
VDPRVGLDDVKRKFLTVLEFELRRTCTISTLTSEREKISETLVFNSELTRLIARDFRSLIHCESSKSYLYM